jgi:hypothetical protein
VIGWCDGCIAGRGAAPLRLYIAVGAAALLLYRLAGAQGGVRRGAVALRPDRQGRRSSAGRGTVALRGRSGATGAQQRYGGAGRGAAGAQGGALRGRRKGRCGGAAALRPYLCMRVV